MPFADRALHITAILGIFLRFPYKAKKDLNEMQPYRDAPAGRGSGPAPRAQAG